MSLFWLLGFCPPTFATSVERPDDPEDAFYHPDDVAGKSAKFAAASEVVGPKFEAGEKQVGQLGRSVGRLELGVALLGDLGTPEAATFAQATRRQLTGQYLRLQRHVELIQDDFSNVFGLALERALVTVAAGKDVEECAGSGIAAMMHRSDCSGQDLNAPLAAAMDADAQLGKELADILALEWPTVALASSPQPVVPVTGADRWVSLWAVAEAFAQTRLSERETLLEATLEGLGESLEARDPTAMKAASAARETYDQALGADGKAMRDAVTSTLSKQKSAPASWGWCVNPKTLGGCPGEDVTASVLDLLRADKKFSKISF